MNARHWIHHFETNRHAFAEPDWQRVTEAVCPLRADPRCPLLIRSLATFQLGERGGGTRLLRFVHRECGNDAPGDPDPTGYVRAMKLFVAEEQYHAELLAHLVRYLDGELLRRHWMNGLFRSVRSLVNLEFNIQVLLTAELIAEAYYGSLHRRVDDPVIHAVTGKILADEVRHIALHAEFFRHRSRRRLPITGTLWALQFQAIFLATERAVWADHGRCLAAFGTSREDFSAIARGACRRFLESVLLPAGARTAFGADTNPDLPARSESG